MLVNYEYRAVNDGNSANRNVKTATRHEIRVERADVNTTGYFIIFRYRFYEIGNESGNVSRCRDDVLGIVLGRASGKRERDGDRSGARTKRC